MTERCSGRSQSQARRNGLAGCSDRPPVWRELGRHDGQFVVYVDREVGGFTGEV